MTQNKIIINKIEIVLDEKILDKLERYFECLNRIRLIPGIDRDILMSSFSRGTNPGAHRRKRKAGFLFYTKPDLSSYCFITNKGNPLTQPSLHREVIKALKLLKFQHADKFTTKSTLIMYGRRIIELKGNHKPTIKALKQHLNFKSTSELFKFLYINEYKGYKDSSLKSFDSVFEHILYDLQETRQFY